MTTLPVHMMKQAATRPGAVQRCPVGPTPARR